MSQILGLLRCVVSTFGGPGDLAEHQAELARLDAFLEGLDQKIAVQHKALDGVLQRIARRAD